MVYNFNSEVKYISTLEEKGINIKELLKSAGVSEQVIKSENWQFNMKQYKNIFKVLDAKINIDLLVGLCVFDKVNIFIPEFFAGLCAADGFTCIDRIAKYKKIIAPIEIKVERLKNNTYVSYQYIDGEALPRFALMNAHINLVDLIRQGTDNYDISPIKILTQYDYPSKAINYLGITPIKSKENVIVFKNEDLKKSFITKNNRMWEYLKKGLDEKAEKFNIYNSISTDVQEAFIKLLPSGISDIESVAYELGTSKRSLQRKLKQEDTTFKLELRKAREWLVKDYLKNNLPLTEIAFLINYGDAKVLSRAFKTWTGVSISEYKSKYIIS